MEYLHICTIKLIFRDKHERRSIQIIRMEKTRSKLQTVVVTCITTYIYRRLIGLPVSNRGIQQIILNRKTDYLNPTDKTLNLTTS
jgi:hypothetical protein